MSLHIVYSFAYYYSSHELVSTMYHKTSMLRGVICTMANFESFCLNIDCYLWFLLIHFRYNFQILNSRILHLPIKIELSLIWTCRSHQPAKGHQIGRSCVFKKNLDVKIIGSPMSDIFLTTSKYGACENVRTMHTPPKLDTPCPKSFRQLLNMVHLKK